MTHAHAAESFCVINVDAMITPMFPECVHSKGSASGNRGFWKGRGPRCSPGICQPEIGPLARRKRFLDRSVVYTLAPQGDHHRVVDILDFHEIKEMWVLRFDGSYGLDGHR